MTPEEKDLLLKDLCARLPYGTIVHYDDYFDKSYPRPNEVLTINALAQFAEELERWNVKPYLSSMSSMTEDEKKELIQYVMAGDNYGENIQWIEMQKVPEYFDWLNKNHFDYRGLIEKGLALEAPEGMYNNKGE